MTVPHRNLIKALMLAGIPIVSKSASDIGIVHLMREYNFNDIPTATYDEIKEELEEIPGASDMIFRNADIRVTYSNRKGFRGDGQPFIDQNVIKCFPFPPVCSDIISYFSMIRIETSKMGRAVIGLLSSIPDRQAIEVMLCHGITYDNIAAVLNDRPYNKSKIPVTYIMAYYDYIWTCTLNNMRFGEISGLVEYLTINKKNKFYDPHRNFMNLPKEEVVSHFGYSSEDVRGHMNRKVYSYSVSHVVDSLRNGTRAKDWIAKMYMYSDNAIGEEKRTASLDDVRTKMDSIFEGIEIVADKRASMSDLYKHSGDEEPEQDEPFTIKR